MATIRKADGKRRDSKGRILRQNEDVMADGRFRFRYVDDSGNRKTVYSWKLVPTDPLPQGKRQDTSLREKEEEIQKNAIEGIKTDSRKTINDIYKVWISLKRNLKDNTNSKTHHNIR